MKRTLLILLSVLLVFSLIACGGKDEKVTEEFVDTADAVETGDVAEEEVAAAEAKAAEANAENTEETKEEAKPEEKSE